MGLFLCLRVCVRDTGLELDKDGFIAVDRTLRSVNTPSVFAAGESGQFRVWTKEVVVSF